MVLRNDNAGTAIFANWRIVAIWISTIQTMEVSAEMEILALIILGILGIWLLALSGLFGLMHKKKVWALILLSILALILISVAFAIFYIVLIPLWVSAHW